LKNAIPELYWCCEWETRSNKSANWQWISVLYLQTLLNFTLGFSRANYCFVAVDVGAVGKSSDSSILKKSNIGRKLEWNQLGIPGTRLLPNEENGKRMPFVIVGDEAFAS
jgi:hypothetical protein